MTLSGRGELLSQMPSEAGQPISTTTRPLQLAPTWVAGLSDAVIRDALHELDLAREREGRGSWREQLAFAIRHHMVERCMELIRSVPEDEVTVRRLPAFVQALSFVELDPDLRPSLLLRYTLKISVSCVSGQ